MKILHLFRWKLEAIISKLDNIKKAEWDAILISPVQPSKDEEDWDTFWKVYQITSMTIGNKYGSEEELRNLCREAHNRGLKIFVDTIVTHYANEGGGNDRFTPHHNVDKSLKNNKYFWREKIDIDYNSRYSITHHCNGLAAIDVSNYDYQDLVAEFYNNLIDCGIDGIRIDSAKMISLPEEDGNNFFPRVKSKLNKDILIFGEVIHEEVGIIRMYQKYITVLMENSDKVNKIDQHKAIIFEESHDSFHDSKIGYSALWSDQKTVEKYSNLNVENKLFFSRPNRGEWEIANWR